MTWVDVAPVLTMIALMFAVAYYLSKKASQPFSETEVQEQVRELDRLEASKPKRPWADDPIAQSIEWTGTSAWRPTPGAGALSIRQASSDRVELHPRHPRTWHAFILLLAVVGAAVIYLQLGSILQASIAVLVGIAFSLSVWFLIYLFGGMVTFDRARGVFWEGRAQPGEIVGSESGKRRGRIADIHALQLISTYRTTGMGSETRTYNTYELNLVMKDGTRLNVSSHDDFESLSRDARVLSKFVGRPLWDAPP